MRAELVIYEEGKGFRHDNYDPAAYEHFVGTEVTYWCPTGMGYFVENEYYGGNIPIGRKTSPVRTARCQDNVI